MLARSLFLLALLFGLALTMQILACALWKNWWPALTGLVYVLVPMPYLFFGNNGDSFSYYSMGADGGWVDVGKFLTGLTAVLAIGIPVILADAEMINPMQLTLAIPSALLLGGVVVLYDYLSKQDSDRW